MELWEMGAVALGRLIRDGAASSREVTQAHLDRITQENPHVNALVEVLGEQALDAAETADREIRQGRPAGPLHGVPFTVKSNVDLAGSATTHGVVALRDVVSPVDAPHVARLRSAGAIPLGRTNMPDYGFRWHTDNALHGATRNPWDSTRTPGGSGGGDAAAVATGMTPLALGNDYGGSLRVPAQACGVTALKPTTGRIPQYAATAPGELPLTIQSFAVQGAMARNVADLASALSLMAGPDPRDPWSTTAPLRGPELPRRVAMTIDPAGGGVDPQVADGVRRAAAALTAAGYEVEEIEPPQVEQGVRAWSALVATEVRLNPPFWYDSLSEGARTFVESFLAVTPVLGLEAYARALADRQAVARAWSLFQERYPLVLGPVCTYQPFEVGADLRGDDEVAALVDGARLVLAVNLLGLPAVASPVGVSGGLPQAVQLIGPRYREDLPLEAAQALEDRLGVSPITPRDARRPTLTR